MKIHTPTSPGIFVTFVGAASVGTCMVKVCTGLDSLSEMRPDCGRAPQGKRNTLSLRALLSYRQAGDMTGDCSTADSARCRLMACRVSTDIAIIQPKKIANGIQKAPTPL